MSEQKLPSQEIDLAPDDIPAFATDQIGLTPVSDHMQQLTRIPPSRMFLLKKSLREFTDRYPDRKVFDASQGDGGASLSGVSEEVLARAAALQHARGTSYDQPFGTREFQASVFEKYWQIDAGLGVEPANIIATVGGRDALTKAYRAILATGYGRLGDLVMVSRVPWISYNWGPFEVGANTLLAPGSPQDGWAYSEEGLQSSVAFARRHGREVAALVITSPDNPTGRTLTPERQAQLARTALGSGVGYIIFDWMYHRVTDENPMDLNGFLSLFTPEDRERLVFLDGLTKSLGASNIRNAHLIAPTPITRCIIALASHDVIPSYYSQAVAMAAIDIGFSEASRPIVEPTNESRIILKAFLEENGFQFILGKGYYAFIDVRKWLEGPGWADSEALGQYLALEHGLAVVPGVFFSSYGGGWIRFSYATPPEVTQGALQRLKEGLEALV